MRCPIASTVKCITSPSLCRSVIAPPETKLALFPTPCSIRPRAAALPRRWGRSTATGSVITSSRGKNHRIIGERLELQCVARGIVKKHRRLFARLPGEADMRLDDKRRARAPQPIGERVPIGHRQHDAEMRHGHVVAVDRVGVGAWACAGIEMRDDLMAVEIEIDPFGRAAALAAAKHTAVKGARGGEIVTRKGEREKNGRGGGGK